jgi:hypothetical protein
VITFSFFFIQIGALKFFFGLLKSIFIHIEGKEESKEYMKSVEFKSNSRKQLAQSG